MWLCTRTLQQSWIPANAFSLNPRRYVNGRSGRSFSKTVSLCIHLVLLEKLSEQFAFYRIPLEICVLLSGLEGAQAPAIINSAAGNATRASKRHVPWKWNIDVFYDNYCHPISHSDDKRSLINLLIKRIIPFQAALDHHRRKNWFFRLFSVLAKQFK